MYNVRLFQRLFQIVTVTLLPVQQICPNKNGRKKPQGIEEVAQW
jgi:hypothetical protein